MQRTLLALALLATASVSTATVSYAQMAPKPGYAPQPGYSQTRPTNNAQMNPGMVQAPSSAMPMQNGPQYGRLYDAQGNRLDARGNIISPQTR